MASKEDLIWWTDAETAIIEGTQNSLEEVLASLEGVTDPDIIRDVFLNEVPYIIDTYGSVASSAAAEWFEALIELNPYIPDMFDPETWKSSTRWALSPLYAAEYGTARMAEDWAAVNEAKRKAFSQIVTTATSRVMDYGRETIAESAQWHHKHGRDVYWARVPTDPNPCKFCRILASRGPVYSSRESAGDFSLKAHTYHDHCSCKAVPVRGKWQIDKSTPRGLIWDGQGVAGYDFDKYYNEYKHFYDELSAKATKKAPTINELVSAMDKAERAKRKHR